MNILGLRVNSIEPHPELDQDEEGEQDKGCRENHRRTAMYLIKRRGIPLRTL